MFELGDKSEKFHKEVGNLISSHKVDEVYTIGKRSKQTSDNLGVKILKRHFYRRSQLLKFLKEFKLEGSVILVKGSRGMRMEEFVNVIEKRVK